MIYITQNPQPMCFKRFSHNLRDLDHNFKKCWLHQQNQLEKRILAHFSQTAEWPDLQQRHKQCSSTAEMAVNSVTDRKEQPNFTTWLCLWCQRLT